MPRKPKVSTELVVREKLSRSAKDPKSEDTSVSEVAVKKTKAAPKKTAPKKAVKAKPDTPKKKSKGHPTYQKMIKNALKADSGNRKGTSVFALYNFMEANYTVPSNFKLYARNAVKKMVEDGLIVKPTPLRYKLSKNEKAKLIKKKKTTKKETKEKKDKKDKKSKKSTKEKKEKTKKSSKDKKEKTKKSKKTEKSPKKETKKRTTKTKGESSPTSSPAKTRGTKAATKSTRGVAKPKAGASEAKTSEATGELVWMWQYYDNGFHNYDTEASNVVEGVYQEYKTSPYTTDVRSVKSGQWNYLVDFREMTQQNVQHESHTKRKIRRVQVPASEATDKHKNYGKGDL